MPDTRERQLARVINRYVKPDEPIALRLVMEAQDAGIPVSLACALVEKESGFRNIFGCDRGGPFCHKEVTLDRVQRLIEHVRAGGTSNGVGLTQLTYGPLVIEAHRECGVHRPACQMRVGFRHLASLIRRYGEKDGIRRYNGSGLAAQLYSLDVRRRKRKWHRRFKKEGLA